MSTTPQERRAYSLAELARLCGHHRSWAYRMAREGRIKTIVGFGKELVPKSEIDRILGETQTTEAGVQ